MDAITWTEDEIRTLRGVTFTGGPHTLAVLDALGHRERAHREVAAMDRAEASRLDRRFGVDNEMALARRAWAERHEAKAEALAAFARKVEAAGYLPAF